MTILLIVLGVINFMAMVFTYEVSESKRISPYEMSGENKESVRMRSICCFTYISGSKFCADTH